MKDSLGDEMKRLEADTSLEAFSYDKPIYIRVDGRAFHTFTKLLRKRIEAESSGVDGGQFLKEMSWSMKAGTEHVLNSLHADIGYFQSDEASFGWFPKSNELSEHPFNGKVMKLASVVPSLFTIGFYHKLHQLRPQAAELLWHYISFDGRVVDVGSVSNLQRMFWWRGMDATRNAVNMFARVFWSQKELHGVKTVELKRRIAENEETRKAWENLHIHFKEGGFIAKDDVLPSEMNIDGSITRQAFINLFDSRK